MAELDKVLLDLVKPMVEDKDSLEVRIMPSADDNEVLLHDKMFCTHCGTKLK